jgi:hypothetical protein
MLKLSLLIFTILLNFNCFSQNDWCIRNENGEELLLTIQINRENRTFEAHTRTDALKEMAGTFTYMLAKTAGKLRFPEIVHSEGKISYNGDTIFYDGNFDYLDKSFPLKAKSWQNNFTGILTDNRNRTHPLTGEKVGSNKPLRDYSSLIGNAFLITENYCWDRTLSKSNDWLTFKSKVGELKNKIADDYELGAVIFWFGKKIPFAPYEIRKISKKENDPKSKRVYSVHELKPGTAFLDLAELPGEKTEMDDLFIKVQKKEYSMLILDARGRKNMKLVSAALLADHLTAKPADWGVYLTRKWLDNNSSIPKPTEYAKTFKNAATLPSNFGNLNQENGCYLKPDPAQTVFHGKIYLLTDQKTSRIAEALAIWLKNDKLATLVGKKSSGQPMLFEPINLDSQYRITIPTAQFYDKTGKSWYGTGVEPDLVIDGDALGYVVKL